MNQDHKKVTLAYSGGLDTSYCIPYLKDLGYHIHAVTINTGGFSGEELQEMEDRAMALGADKFECIAIENEYYDQCLRYLIYGNILRNNTYPLSVSSERPFQSLALLEYCRKHNIKAVAHGSTGAGNDQIRFDIIFKSLAPEIEIISPIRDQSLSREAEMNYLKAKGFEWNAVQKTYSINQGIWGTSIGGKETLTSDLGLPEQAYPRPVTANDTREIQLVFEKGELVSIEGLGCEKPLPCIKALDQLASSFGVGRDIHVGDTIIGIKGRVGFEAGGPLIIIKAHELLEKHTLTKWQMHWKKQLADWYGMMLHEGQYLDPTLRNIENFLVDSQKNVSGKVGVKISPYRFELVGVTSENDLMQAKFGSYGEENKAWSGEDAKGFTQILSTAGRIYYSIHKNEKPC